MPYFSSKGHDCYAVSLRGTDATGMPPEAIKSRSVKVEDHVQDIEFVLDRLNTEYSSAGVDLLATKPIIVAHSFGGIIAMKLLEMQWVRNKISGVALLCSVPPSGNAAMTKRLIERNLCAALKIVWGLVLKAVTFHAPTCRDLFFDKSVPEQDITRFAF